MARSSQNNLSNVVRDFKLHTSFEIVKNILSDPEIRREWILNLFSEAASKHKRNENYQVWTHENYAAEIFSPAFTLQRINYIHQNPVRASIVLKAEDYVYSNASDYAGSKGIINIELLNLHLLLS